MASQAALNQLRASKRSVHSSKQDTQVIDEQTQNIKSAIDTILAKIANPYGLSKDLAEDLEIISEFFRKQKFTTVVLPVLDEISKIDVDIWKIATQGDTQIPLVPKSFENMKASTIEVRGRYDMILCPLVRERELALLSVYGVTLITIGDVFFILDKKQQP